MNGRDGRHDASKRGQATSTTLAAAVALLFALADVAAATMVVRRNVTSVTGPDVYESDLARGYEACTAP